jgi:hypothetical protein
MASRDSKQTKKLKEELSRTIVKQLQQQQKSFFPDKHFEWLKTFTCITKGRREKNREMIT